MDESLANKSRAAPIVHPAESLPKYPQRSFGADARRLPTGQPLARSPEDMTGTTHQPQ